MSWPVRGQLASCFMPTQIQVGPPATLSFLIHILLSMCSCSTSSVYVREMLQLVRTWSLSKKECVEGGQQKLLLLNHMQLVGGAILQNSERKQFRAGKYRCPLHTRLNESMTKLICRKACKKRREKGMTEIDSSLRYMVSSGYFIR